ncbi:hypothetical protein B9Z55_029111 [Caenorhabditis nigoni]|uniref:F-box domain-containing protein n=1 Tax=Caenorhabditis nigoni TaxID=1611254 RepID=A0A2G5S8N5_9PELO|nr:hypothetical protein B9Z55_029111 [Caenorhabditis nigoni]
MPISLPQLPVLVRDEVLQQMNFLEKLYLSFCSKRCLNQLKSIRDSTIIQTSIDFGDMDKIIACNEGMYMEFPKKMRYGKEYQKMIINGMKIRVKMKDGKLTVVGNFKRPKTPLLVFLEHLEEFCRFSETFVTLDLDHFTDYSILLDYFPFTNLKTLCIRSKEKSVPSEELNRLMSRFEVSEYVKICILNDKDFKLDNSIRFRLSDCLDIRNAVCLSPETFLNSSECSKIEIFGADFKPEVYEQFVSNWYQSTNQLLDYVSSWDKPRHEVSNFDKFQPMPWDAQRRSQYYNAYGKRIDCSNGLDIIRSDGMMATIIDTFISFQFYVWKNPFPTFP